MRGEMWKNGVKFSLYPGKKYNFGKRGVGQKYAMFGEYTALQQHPALPYLNISWAPQPIPSVPLAQVPHVFPV